MAKGQKDSKELGLTSEQSSLRSPEEEISERYLFKKIAHQEIGLDDEFWVPLQGRP